jgi:hypothetical protein
MFRDNLPTFPDNKLILGRYLGPATDVGSALTAKILKSNGQTVCRSTLWHLTDEETHCPIHLETRRVFDETVASHLGPNATDQDFLAEDLTPDFDHYDNDHDLDPDHGDIPPLHYSSMGNVQNSRGGSKGALGAGHSVGGAK